MDIFMHRCLELAQRAKGNSAPNPMVGAVLVHNGRIIGEGWHRRYGEHHAEVNCLEYVAEADKPLIPQSTMYVSLEPCAHYGHTPPCAARLVQEGIKKVVIANTDPFEQVKGKGIEILTAAGAEVETGLLAREGLWVNRRFFCYHQQQRPYIILKWAQTREGYIAPADKSRFQITGSAVQEIVHKWRTEEAAIMVGTTTAINDNPQLTARLWHGRQPLRIAIDRNLTIPPQHHIFNTDANTWIINEKQGSETGNVKYVQLPWDNNLLQAIIAQLHKVKILSVIVEGGAALLNSFIAAGLWDEARVFTGNASLANGLPAPHVAGGRHAFATTIDKDRLDVYVQQYSQYQYVEGMEL